MLRAIFLILITTGSAFSGDKLYRVERMFEDEAPFSFEVLYGSRQTLEAMQAAEKIEVYRLDPENKEDTRKVRGYAVLKGPIELAGAKKKEIRDLLLSKDSFGSRPACPPVPGVLVSVASGKAHIDFEFCFVCESIIIRCNDEDDVAVVSMTDKSLKPFLRTFQGLFPEDDELKKIKIK